ncbi:MAG: YncE family protein [Methanobacteriota archaeon]|nr:MAG: YncE family protein [Euryarchaeota archaeon]
MARNRAVALVGAVLIVLVALPSLTWGNASGFLGETRGNENQLTEGLVSLAPSQGSWNGTVVATIPVGNGPIGVGYSGGSGYVYVTNYESNSVSVIDRTTVVATIRVGNGPAAAGYDGGNGYVYVANELSNNVSVINRTTVVGTVAVGNQPEGVGYDNRSGYIYVANFGSNNVSVINGTTVVATIPVGIYPIYVSNEGPNTVSVINGTTVVATVPVGNSPFGVGYDSSGDGNVYVANLGSATVSVISRTTVVATVFVGTAPYGVGYDSANRYVYVANFGSSTVSVISPPPPSPPVVTASAAGDQGTNGWFTSPATLTLTATDTGSGVRVITYSVAGGPWQNYAAPLTFSDGTYVVNYTATDWAGNTADVNTLVLRVDSVPPRIDAFESGTVGANGWFTSLTIVSLNASDNGSGVQRLSYRLDDEATEDYSGPITLSEGVRFINATATDVAGNIAVDPIEVRVDVTPPVLQPKALPPTVTTGSVTMSWSGNDNTSGISRYEVSVDGGARQGVGMNTSFIVSLPDGSHTITVWAVDAAGNNVSRFVTFRVDTNTFSPSGPYAKGLTYGIIVTAAAVAGLFLWRRRRRASPPPASPPQGGGA